MVRCREQGKNAPSRVAATLVTLGLCAGIVTWIVESSAVLGAAPSTRQCEKKERLNPRANPSAASIASAIRGVVLSPRLQTFDTGAGGPSNFPLAFSVDVNVDPDFWRVEVDVLRSGSANPQNESSWCYNIASLPRTGGGPDVYRFEARDVLPFRVNLDGPPHCRFALAEAWRPGGLARLRLVAVRKSDPSQCAFLPGLDSDGLDPANPYTLVIADSSVDPTKPLNETDQSIRDRFNPRTPNYLSANQRIPSWLLPTTPEEEPVQMDRQKQTTTAYYRAIRTSDTGTGPSIWRDLSTLESFKNRYFKEACRDGTPPPDETMATYFNKGDLGIGREMHCIYRECTDELACYVRNFAALVDVCRYPDRPELCKEPVFDNKEGAHQALLDDSPFATVAMVERGKMVGSPNNVFFVVYDANGNLNTAGAQLDNKAFNTSIPGNCIQCHGISSTYAVRSAFQIFPPRFFRRHEVTGAMFLPFDLNAFEFFSEDEDDPRSRPYQEPAFRALNKMVLDHSTLGRSPAAREVIEGWYRGDLTAGGGRTFQEFFGPEDGWLRAIDAPMPAFARVQRQQLYRKFVAVGCRTCHISAVEPGNLTARSPLSFSRYEDFIGEPRVKLEVCDVRDNGRRMPAAEQTHKVLWRSPGRPSFFGHVPGLFGDCAP